MLKQPSPHVRSMTPARAPRSKICPIVIHWQQQTAQQTQQSLMQPQRLWRHALGATGSALASALRGAVSVNLPY